MDIGALKGKGFFEGRSKGKGEGFGHWNFMNVLIHVACSERSKTPAADHAIFYFVRIGCCLIARKARFITVPE